MVNKGVSSPTGFTRWFQLICGFVLMMSISSSQYVWTLFVDPL